MTLEHCYQQCDQLDTGCCGFALLSVVGDLLCVYYSQCGALGPAQDHNLVGPNPTTVPVTLVAKDVVSTQVRRVGLGQLYGCSSQTHIAVKSGCSERAANRTVSKGGVRAADVRRSAASSPALPGVASLRLFRAPSPFP